ncbi:MAG TPA: malectin domain-containing carbohydrate-binding protein [Candidatus Saccharimonadales bacterium]|nr:malectin domain-containing carbohydrate-binding protein [Candidatus Saccharimonadales bacterium]
MQNIKNTVQKPAGPARRLATLVQSHPLFRQAKKTAVKFGGNKPRVVLPVLVIAALSVTGTITMLGARAATPPPAGGYFQQVPAGQFSSLPDDATAASRVKRSPWEPRPENYSKNNSVPPQPVTRPGYSGMANGAAVFGRVTGNFKGTTDEIIQWTAIKWGLSDDMIRAQLINESSWYQGQKDGNGWPINGRGYGDFGHCGGSPPGSGYGSGGPTSFGLPQIKWCAHANTWPNSERYSAYAMDYYGAIMRGCLEGWDYVTSTRNDTWGCVGRWFSGEWYSGNAQYIADAKTHLANKPWRSFADRSGSLPTTPTPSLTPTPPPTTTPPPSTSPLTVPVRIESGGSAYTDPSGQSWRADSYVSGGGTVDRGSGVAISGTTADRIYQTERYGSMTYNIPIANGTYKYRMHFAETYDGCFAAGCRVFSVTAEGSTIISNLDIYASVGPNAALVREGTFTVNDGSATFGFAGSSENPLVSGIEILANTTTTTPPATTTPPPPASVVKDAALGVSPSTSSVAAGSNLNVTIRLNSPAQQAYSVQSILSYPADKLQYVSASNSSTFPTASRTANASGSLDIIRGIAGGASGVTGQHDVVTVTFKAINTISTTASLNFQATSGVFNSAGHNILASTGTGNYTLTTAPTTTPGDANGDGRINALDLSLVLSNDGQNYPAADFNRDGVVGAADLSILLGKWTW